MHAASMHENFPDLPVIMSGGRAWEGITEAAAMAAWWSNQVMLTGQLLLESKSMTTRQNAYWVARLCEREGFRRVALVTCDFHMPRATQLFLAQGLEVVPCAATTIRSRREKLGLYLREWGARLLAPWETKNP
jgi:uncharacterized SAM-binding protein YcdF (DUF218 family)